MKEKLKVVILIPYAASAEGFDCPKAEAEYLYKEHFMDASLVQIVGEGLDGRLYVKDNVGLYIIGEGKTNAAINCTALLNDNRYNFEDTKFILFGCCGCAKGTGVVGDIYFISETVDYDLGHHADPRDFQNEPNHCWYPNESFERFGYFNLVNSFLEQMFDYVNNENLQTTQNTKEFMARTFNNKSWAIREPKIMKAVSVTSDSYWKGNHDHDNAKYIAEYYNCKYPLAATDMEDISVAQLMKKYRKMDDFLTIRFAVNTDVFMAGQTPETLWGEGSGSFDSSGFDNFNEVFPIVTKRATEILWKIISSL